ncbi:MAG: tol-pal system protein YbgF [Gammaproteobacteria bacterium]|nr:MAG: tol-pal system protein YbgF [Gammaproteobacteria bacterium]
MKVVIKPARGIFLAGIVLAGFVTTPVFAQGTLTPEQMSLRIERLTELSQRSEAKLSAVQAQLKTLSDDMSRLGRLVDNRAMLDMIQQVEEISEEVGLLRGNIEIQGNDINEIKKRQRELYLDIDRRLRDIESGATAAAPKGQISVPKVDSTVSSTSSQQTPSVAPATSQPSTTQPSTPAPTPSVTQSEEKAAYQAAFDTLKEGRYKKAKTELSAFLKKFPNSSYAGNAQYWLGEAQYVTRNFEQGIIEFEKVINKYPTSNKLPDAMLKLGYTFYELKQFPQSKAILQDLRDRFPQATAARLATKRLDRIRKEGH